MQKVMRQQDHGVNRIKSGLQSVWSLQGSFQEQAWGIGPRVHLGHGLQRPEVRRYAAPSPVERRHGQRGLISITTHTCMWNAPVRRGECSNAE